MEGKSRRLARCQRRCALFVLSPPEDRSEGDAAALTGDDVPVWREIALEGADGPAGSEGEYAFCAATRAHAAIWFSPAPAAAGSGGGRWRGDFSAPAETIALVRGNPRTPSFAPARRSHASPGWPRRFRRAPTSDLFWYASADRGTPE